MTLNSQQKSRAPSSSPTSKTFKKYNIAKAILLSTLLIGGCATTSVEKTDIAQSSPADSETGQDIVANESAPTSNNTAASEIAASEQPPEIQDVQEPPVLVDAKANTPPSAQINQSEVESDPVENAATDVVNNEQHVSTNTEQAVSAETIDGIEADATVDHQLSVDAPNEAPNEAPIETANDNANPANKTVNKAMLSSLPVSIGAWTLMQDPLSDDNHPHIKSLTFQMGDANYSSQVWVTIEDAHVIVNSTSDIDTRNSGAGIQINKNSFIPFNRYLNSTSALIDKNLLSQLDDGGKLKVKLAFFPGKNRKSELHTAETSIEPLKKLVPQYEGIMQ